MCVAIKLTKVPKECTEVMKLCNVTRKEIDKFFKKIKDLMPGNSMLGTNSSGYVDRVASKLKLPEDIATLCRQTADNITKSEILTGKKPATIAGVALWFILRRNLVYS